MTVEKNRWAFVCRRNALTCDGRLSDLVQSATSTRCIDSSHDDWPQWQWYTIVMTQFLPSTY